MQLALRLLLKRSQSQCWVDGSRVGCGCQTEMGSGDMSHFCWTVRNGTRAARGRCMKVVSAGDGGAFDARPRTPTIYWPSWTDRAVA